ncbi:type II toxin-antitoxin system prevent-host-death family antitoxin [bacterium]|nr:type II toxin-antitoxin system prevent-host-death family antitoxin [bacterium]
MKIFNVHEAKTHFSSILALVATGEEVLVAKAGTPVAVISAYRKPAADRKAGLFKGQIDVKESFFEPMEEDFVSFFQ